MKKVLLILTVLAFNLSNAQKKVKTIDLYDSNIDISEQKKKFKTNVEITEGLILSENSIIRIGDTLTIGSPTGKISDQYATLFVGRYSGAEMAMGKVPVPYTSMAIRNTKVIVERMRVKRSMGRTYIIGDLKQIDVAKKAMFSYVGAYNMKIAFNEKELIDPNAPLTRAEAIAKLKESKELFELDMMSKEEYDSIRKELTPIIKNK